MRCCSVEDDRLSGRGSTFHRFLYGGTVRRSEITTQAPRKSKKIIIILPLRSVERKTTQRASCSKPVLGEKCWVQIDRLLVISCPEKDKMPFTREQWYEILLSFADDKACLSCYMCYIEKWLTRLGSQNSSLVWFDTKTKKMRPCRSEAKQLRCIGRSCSCETARAFHQGSSDPLVPRDGLGPGREEQ